ncbi:MAG: hypothetical protein R3C19_10930 [Planctomycetaceae bacterium]
MSPTLSEPEVMSWYRAASADGTTNREFEATGDGITPPREVFTAAEVDLAWLHHVEAWLGTILGTLLTLLVGGVMLIRTPPILAVVALAIAFGEYSFLKRMWYATVTGRRPIGVAVASGASVGNRAIRILAAGWWIFHIAMAMGFVVFLEAMLIERGQVRQLAPTDVTQTLVVGTIAFGISICCNTYLALLVKAVFGSDTAVRFFWRGRFIVDVAMTLLAILFATAA